MTERIAYQFRGDHVLKFAGMEKLTGEQIADELNRLYTIIAEQNEEIAALEREAEPVAEAVTIGGYPDDSEHTVRWLVKYSQIKAGDKLYLATVSRWQPIESAPKGHELFLLYEPHEAGGFQFVGARNIDGDWVNNLDGERQTPSHWMPLPAAPKEKTDEQQ